MTEWWNGLELAQGCQYSRSAEACRWRFRLGHHKSLYLLIIFKCSSLKRLLYLTQLPLYVKQLQQSFNLVLWIFLLLINCLKLLFLINFDNTSSLSRKCLWSKFISLYCFLKMCAYQVHTSIMFFPYYRAGGMSWKQLLTWFMILLLYIGKESLYIQLLYL